MKSWRNRVAAALVVGAAAVTIPLTAGTASAVTDPDGFTLVGATPTHHECQEWGWYDTHYNGYSEFQCRWANGMWQEWVR